MKMRLFFTTRSRRVEKAPRFPLTHFAIVLVVAVFGAASVAGLVATADRFAVPDDFKVYAIALCGVLAFSVAIIPALSAPAWSQASGPMKAVGLLLILPMMFLDGALQVNAVQAAERLTKAEAIAAAQGGLAEVDARIAALGTSESVCEGHGPRNCAERQKGLADDRAALGADRETKAAALKDAQASAVPVEFILALMTGFQLSAFFFRAWLTGITLQKDAALKAERKAARERRAEMKARKPRRKPKLKAVA